MRYTRWCMRGFTAGGYLDGRQVLADGRARVAALARHELAVLVPGLGLRFRAGVPAAAIGLTLINLAPK